MAYRLRNRMTKMSPTMCIAVEELYRLGLDDDEIAPSVRLSLPKTTGIIASILERDPTAKRSRPTRMRYHKQFMRFAQLRTRKVSLVDPRATEVVITALHAALEINAALHRVEGVMLLLNLERWTIHSILHPLKCASDDATRALDKFLDETVRRGTTIWTFQDLVTALIQPYARDTRAALA